jgi:hypothetical protein
MDLMLRPVTEAEIPDFVAYRIVPGNTADDEFAWFTSLDVDRTGVFDDDDRRHRRVFSFELTVPGTHSYRRPGAMVGVHPTHRRRGLPRRMTEEQADVVGRRVACRAHRERGGDLRRFDTASPCFDLLVAPTEGTTFALPRPTGRFRLDRATALDVVPGSTTRRRRQ